MCCWVADTGTMDPFRQRGSMDRLTTPALKDCTTSQLWSSHIKSVGCSYRLLNVHSEILVRSSSAGQRPR